MLEPLAAAGPLAGEEGREDCQRNAYISLGVPSMLANSSSAAAREP